MKNFEIDGEVHFQAYVDTEPVPCIIRNKGTLDELNKINSPNYEKEFQVDQSQVDTTERPLKK